MVVRRSLSQAVPRRCRRRPAERGGRIPLPDVGGTGTVAGRWSYAHGGRRLGPFGTGEFRQLASSGLVRAEDMVLDEATGRWLSAVAVPELAGCFPSAPAASPRPPVPPPPVSPPLPPPPPPPVVSKSACAAPEDKPPPPTLPPSAPPSRLGSDSAGNALLNMVMALGAAARDVAVDTAKEVGRRSELLVLRSRQREEENARSNLHRDVGARLLAGGVCPPEGESIRCRFGPLNSAYTLANQAGQAGDPAKAKEAVRLAAELQTLYAECGRLALAGDFEFDGRSRAVAEDRAALLRARRTAERIAELEAVWRSAPAVAGRNVAIGLAAAVVTLAGVGLWIFSGPGKAPSNTTATSAGAAAPAASGNASLQELFARLSPAVPVVEAVEVGRGSGVLLKRGSRLLVVTNRHVVEPSAKGLALHFYTGRSGSDLEHTVPAAEVRVVAVHRAADLAIIEIGPSAASELLRHGITPLELAPADRQVRPGEHVFAIGHPGAGASSETLTRTLTDGIVSATGRKGLQGEARHLQVTVAINPGNSGGPLFDDRGNVIGVNTFTIRRGAEIALEALNFAVEVRHVHELLDDRAKSLTPGEIAKILSPPEVRQPTVREPAPAYRPAPVFVACRVCGGRGTVPGHVLCLGRGCALCGFSGWGLCPACLGEGRIRAD